MGIAENICADIGFLHPFGSCDLLWLYEPGYPLALGDPELYLGDSWHAFDAAADDLFLRPGAVV